MYMFNDKAKMYEDNYEKCSEDHLRRVCSLLHENNISYWLDRGTLLGALRDNRVIPWDHDIDFGVWEDEVDRETIFSIFSKEGFKAESLPVEYTCMHFLTNFGKKIDFTFYKKNGDMATATFTIPKKGIFRAVVSIMLDCFENNQEGECYKRNSKTVISTIKVPLLFVFFSFIKVLPRGLRSKLFLLLEKIHIKYPTDEIVEWRIPIYIFLNLKRVRFLDIMVNIPVDYERYFCIIFGEDWRIPKEKWIWYKDGGGWNQKVPGY